MRRLIYDPNALHISAVKDQTVQAEGSARALLQRIVGAELAKTVEGYEPPSPLPSAAYDESLISHLNDCGTVIYLWGTRDSGKTSVVGSLLALPEVEIDSRKNNDMMLRRAKALAAAYAPCEDTYSKLPKSEEQQTEVTFATLHHREGFLTRRFKVAFIEADVVGSIPVGLLDCGVEQIHLFCFDAAESPDVQSSVIANRLQQLEDGGYIQQKTCGVYVLVTKVDAMYRVPVGYRSRAAQTMITIRCRSLWQKIRNICYSKGIYGSAPIAFSIGEVKLQAIAHLTDEYSRRLLLSPILQKCRPEPTFIERVMSLGGRNLTTFLAFVFIGGLGYGLYSYFRIDTPAPEQGNAPYKFVPDFKARVGKLPGSREFSDVAQLYDELEADLSTESKIKFFTSKGEQPLIPADSSNLCRHKLDSTMAEIVHKKVEREMRASAWDDGLLRSCLHYADRLKSNRSLSLEMRQNLTDHSDHIRTYFEILNLIRYTSCSSVSEVEDKIRRANGYKELPYTNNDEVRRGLEDVPVTAVSSCAEHLEAVIDSLERELESLSMWDSLWDSGRLKVQIQQAEEALQQLNDLAQKYGVKI